ncbi:hypothetical protein C497_01987 [Halalkalicoccus jeotgali B3]|uniref:Uncharacterized protein n=1 Tax=Halalkalicoccus jeotgali (strain DSM 18796 / CECT 7217 / JCM 14584 / KCTC 4019 / B3) TaxID=795797 RepID=L9VVF8_HALJB|nr:hypothetical protein [Halalkalicoccus jeotgali]ELY41169.1 hypothetical protein C497_01987 [Halalkalicoccus jeotgali B3]
MLTVTVALLASSVGAVGVLAQAGAPGIDNATNSTNATPSDAPTAPGVGGNNTTSGNSTGTGGPIGIAQGVLNTGANIATGGAQAAANMALGPIFTFILDIPTIDIGLTDPGGIHTPTSSPYDILFPVLYVGIAVPITTVAFGIITFASFGAAPFASLRAFPWSTHGTLSRGVRAFVAILGGIVFHLVGFSIVHELFAGFTEHVAASPAQMIENMGLLDFSLATAFVGMGLYEMGWDILKWAGLLYAIIWIYIAFFPMISMPFTAAWLYSPTSTFGKFSGYLHVTHLALLISKAAVAVQLFAASQLDWGLSFDGIVAAFVSLGLIASALATPPLMLIFMWLSKGRLIAAVGAGAGAAAGSSAVAAKVREKAPDTERVKEQGKGYVKRKGAAAQGKWWDVKNRAQFLGSAASGSAAGVAYSGKERFNRWRSDDPGVGSSSKTSADGGVSPTRSERMRRFEEMNDRAGGSSSKTSADGGVSPTRSERMRRFEEMNDRAGGLTTTQRKRYFNLKMEEKGAFDSGLGTDGSEGSDGK